MADNCTVSGGGPQDFIAYWPLDADFDDVSGNGYHATLQGTLTFVPGVDGNGVSFSSGNYFDLPNFNLPTGTISAWVYVRSLGTQKIFRGPSSLICFGQYQNQWGGCGPQNMGVVINAWHHVAIVHGLNGFYLDGTFVNIGTPMAAAANEITHVGGPPFSEWFDGVIDEIKWYDRPLSPAEVSDLAWVHRQRYSGPLIMGRWMLRRSCNNQRRLPGLRMGVTTPSASNDHGTGQYAPSHLTHRPRHAIYLLQYFLYRQLRRHRL
ncbi:MAG: LamG domain-containing protein [Saprospirales bacterium]|nr:LamG domain-containing protein [Saprospirales bacterium]